MKLYAISDLHLDHRVNREALGEIPDYGDDWLILAGDVCSSLAHLETALTVLTQRFGHVLWVPGNHELWVTSRDDYPDSVAKYQAMVELCRRFGVSTPEDPYPLWQQAGSAYRIAPLHLLYDYSFRPVHIKETDAVDWAVESGVLCKDEMLIDAGEFGSKANWCQARLAYTQARLEAAGDQPLVLVNHFPLRYDLVRTMRIPRFSIWCGTRETEAWHQKYPVQVVVSGHLHMRCTDFRHGVRFEEVSLGYPRDWRQERGVAHYLRQILPGPAVSYYHAGPFWKMRH